MKAVCGIIRNPLKSFSKTVVVWPLFRFHFSLDGLECKFLQDPCFGLYLHVSERTYGRQDIGATVLRVLGLSMFRVWGALSLGFRAS